MTGNRQYFADTDMRGLRTVAIEQRSPRDNWEQLDRLLRERLGPEHAELFAEPEPRQSGGVSWFTGRSGDGVRLDALTEDGRRALEARTEALMAPVRDLAAELRRSEADRERLLGAMLDSATCIPFSRLESSLYSFSGAPVLVDWGTREDRSGAPPEPLRLSDRFEDRERPRITDAVRRAAPERGGWGIWALFAWLPFALLVALLAWRLLPACGMFGEGALLGNCEGPGVPPELAMRQARTRELLDELAVLRQRVAEAPSCALGDGADAGSASVVTHLPPRTVGGPGEVSLNERLRSAGATICEGPELVLEWSGRTPLELVVFCPVDADAASYPPDRILSLDGPTNCGAAYDVDQVEGPSKLGRICFTSDAPAGSYLASVASEEGEDEAAIPFDLHFRGLEQMFSAEGTIRPGDLVDVLPIELGPAG